MKNIMRSIILLTAALIATSASAAGKGEYISLDELEFGQEFALKSVVTGKWLYVNTKGQLWTGQTRKKAAVFKMKEPDSRNDGDKAANYWGWLTTEHNGSTFVLSPKGTTNGIDLMPIAKLSDDDEVIWIKVNRNSNQDNMAIELRNGRYLSLMDGDERWQATIASTQIGPNVALRIYALDD